MTVSLALGCDIGPFEFPYKWCHELNSIISYYFCIYRDSFRVRTSCLLVIQQPYLCSIYFLIWRIERQNMNRTYFILNLISFLCNNTVFPYGKPKSGISTLNNRISTRAGGRPFDPTAIGRSAIRPYGHTANITAIMAILGLLRINGRNTDKIDKIRAHRTLHTAIHGMEDNTAIH